MEGLDHKKVAKNSDNCENNVDGNKNGFQLGRYVFVIANRRGIIRRIHCAKKPSFKDWSSSCYKLKNKWRSRRLLFSSCLLRMFRGSVRGEGMLSGLFLMRNLKLLGIVFRKSKYVKCDSAYILTNHI